MAERKKWDAAQRAELLRLADSGLCASQIADAMGRSPGSVYFKAAKMGLVLARSPHVGWSAQARAASSRAARWGAEQEARLQALVNEHGADNFTLIAHIIGRKRDIVRQKILQMEMRAPKTAVRGCMRCATPFRSEGPHHRMCAECRHGNGLPDMWQAVR